MINTQPAPDPQRTRPGDDECVLDVARRAARTGMRLVTDGRDIYLTPMKRPGEFDVGVSVKEAA